MFFRPCVWTIKNIFVFPQFFMTTITCTLCGATFAKFNVCWNYTWFIFNGLVLISWVIGKFTTFTYTLPIFFIFFIFFFSCIFFFLYFCFVHMFQKKNKKQDTQTQTRYDTQTQKQKATDITVWWRRALAWKSSIVCSNNNVRTKILIFLISNTPVFSYAHVIFLIFFVCFSICFLGCFFFPRNMAHTKKRKNETQKYKYVYLHDSVTFSVLGSVFALFKRADPAYLSSFFFCLCFCFCFCFAFFFISRKFAQMKKKKPIAK